MSHFKFWDFSAMASMRVLFGVWRHDNTMCRPGFYRVIGSADLQWQLPHVHAVCDDFGNLVVVP
jgi:hypothetical protein